MNYKRIIFMGTPIFASRILQGLIDHQYLIVGVVSQPDRLVGRKKMLTSTSVKEVALKNNIPVFQPEKIKNDFTFIKELKPDVILTCAYGQIISKEILDIPPLGCFNIHASLLPKLRGGAPIQRAIMEGYRETGVTLMRMIVKMDAGEMFDSVSTPIFASDTYGILHDRLSDLGLQLILKNMKMILENRMHGVNQNEEDVTYGYNIRREEEKIDWNQNAKDVVNHIRGLNPFPGAYSIICGEIYKIYAVEVVEENFSKEPGFISRFDNGLIVQCQENSVRILEIQPFSKNKMNARDFMNGKGKTLLHQTFDICK